MRDTLMTRYLGLAQFFINVNYIHISPKNAWVASNGVRTTDLSSEDDMFK